MVNLIKSHNYTLCHNMLSVITLFSITVLPFLGMYFNGFLSGDNWRDMTASTYSISLGGTILEIFLFATLIFSAKAVGGDSGDKTINYELMSGHSRSSVYWSRILTGVFWAVILVIITSLVPYGVLTLVNGWGDGTAPKEILLRLCLSFFPLLRFAAVFMLLTSLVDSAGGGLAIGYGVVLVETILDAVFEEIGNYDMTYIFTISNLSKLMRYNNSWEFVENGKAITWFDYSITNDMIVKTIGFSLITAALYMIIGYVVFKKRDKN